MSTKNNRVLVFANVHIPDQTQNKNRTSSPHLPELRIDPVGRNPFQDDRMVFAELHEPSIQNDD